MHYRAAEATFLLAATAALLAGCGKKPGSASSVVPPRILVPHDPDDSSSAAAVKDRPQAPEAGRLVIDSFAYSPREITVAPGSRVRWVNPDDVPHTVTSTAKPRVFDSGALDGEESFAFTFREPGTYSYFCALHPHMTGKVIVK